MTTKPEKPKKVVLEANWTLRYVQDYPVFISVRGFARLVGDSCILGRRLLRAFGTTKDKRLRITIEEV